MDFLPSFVAKDLERHKVLLLKCTKHRIHVSLLTFKLKLAFFTATATDCDANYGNHYAYLDLPAVTIVVKVTYASSQDYNHYQEQVEE